MSKIKIVYFSLTGNTEQMARYIAEGIRISGNEVEVSKTPEIKRMEDLMGYNGYIFGSPTYHRDMAEPMKTFLFLAKKAELEGKLGGAFGSYTHSGDAPDILLETMQYAFKMEPFKLGALNMLDSILEKSEGMRACQDYGKSFGEYLS
ncbi:flavodoxin domain-containing protein [Chloroflexota bacterium]